MKKNLASAPMIALAILAAAPASLPPRSAAAAPVEEIAARAAAPMVEYLLRMTPEGGALFERVMGRSMDAGSGRFETQLFFERLSAQPELHELAGQLDARLGRIDSNLKAGLGAADDAPASIEAGLRQMATEELALESPRWFDNGSAKIEFVKHETSHSYEGTREALLRSSGEPTFGQKLARASLAEKDFVEARVSFDQALLGGSDSRAARKALKVAVQKFHAAVMAVGEASVLAQWEKTLTGAARVSPELAQLNIRLLATRDNLELLVSEHAQPAGQSNLANFPIGHAPLTDLLTPAFSRDSGILNRLGQINGVVGRAMPETLPAAWVFP